MTTTKFILLIVCTFGLASVCWLAGNEHGHRAADKWWSYRYHYLAKWDGGLMDSLREGSDGLSCREEVPHK